MSHVTQALRSEIHDKSKNVRAWIEETGVIAAVRERSTENALFAAEAVAVSGIPVVEIA